MSSVTPIFVWLFWICLAWVVYSYLLYPIILRVLAALFSHPIKKDPSYTPSIAIIIPVYNEEKVIRRKIQSTLAMNYPSDKLTVWVGSDCSSDRTHEIVKEFTDPRIHLWIASAHKGKTEVLNALVPRMTSDVVLFTDADILIAPDSLREMAACFADPHVGGVAGVTRQVSLGNVAEEKAYRSFEAWQKELEARLHSTISAFGCFYAIRLQLFKAYRSNTYSNDDVLMPMQIIRSGHRMYFEPAATSIEELDGSEQTEFHRRIRIGAGNFQAFFWLLDFLNPLHGWPWFCYVSHKVTRWFSPLIFLIAFVSCLATAVLTGSVLYWALSGSALLVIAAGLSHQIIKLSITRAPYYFMIMNCALGLGFLRYLGGIRSATWSRTERTVSAR